MCVLSSLQVNFILPAATIVIGFLCMYKVRRVPFDPFENGGVTFKLQSFKLTISRTCSGNRWSVSTRLGFEFMYNVLIGLGVVCLKRKKQVDSVKSIQDTTEQHDNFVMLHTQNYELKLTANTFTLMFLKLFLERSK